jgi:hypothetical protein
MELKSMIDFVFYIGNLDIAHPHKEMVTLIFNYALDKTIPMDVCSL